MKLCKAEVTSSRKKGGGYFTDDKGKRIRQVVSSTEYPEYETFEELIKAEGEGNVLKFANAQIATNAKNKSRAEAVGTISDTELNRLAVIRLTTSADSLSKLGELQRQANGDAKLYESLFAQLLEATVSQIKAEKGISDDEDEA